MKNMKLLILTGAIFLSSSFEMRADTNNNNSWLPTLLSIGVVMTGAVYCYSLAKSSGYSFTLNAYCSHSSNNTTTIKGIKHTFGSNSKTTQGE